MNYLYYSLDDGTKAYHKCQTMLVGKPTFSIEELSPGKIKFMGQNEKISIYVCGVDKSESICRMAWAHALHQNGKNTAEWKFIKVDDES